MPKHHVTPQPSTAAQKFVNETLTALMPPDGPYRCGVLMLSYEPGNPGPNSRVAFGIGLRDASEECARDMVDMVKTLRLAADQVEALYKKAEKTDGGV